ncbi:hypothetical protein [Azohydromonas caseinilytica]|uniref:Uncharacterized protein n=1 Tax=Azohydromonas caseinilytica TaxID=2728836 RepID=A0A848F3H0_9BURK|nr:hypothetical protein [Azohydromonas caseinilytica]NML13942.1 hypothetical protein [Azohydromonas caseinilytica]
MGWIALLLGPLLVLGDLGLTYSLIGPGCNLQQGSMLHLPMAASLILCLGLTLWAARTLRRTRQAQPVPGPGGADPDAAQERRRFVAWLAVTLGALSCLVIAAMWLPVAVLSPCTV